MTEATPDRSEHPLDIDPEAVWTRMALHHPDLPVVLLWSEKAGCTSLLKWFLAQTGRLEEALAYSDWVHDWELDVMKAQPSYEEQLHERLRDGSPVIKLVRDPFDRAVSQYLMMVRHPDGSDHPTVAVRRSIRRAVHGDPDVDASYSFEEFLRWLADQDPTELDLHLAPQATALEDALSAAGRTVELLRLERFDEGIRALEERFGLPPVDLAEVTTSRHHSRRRDFVGVSPDAVTRFRFPIPLDRRTYPIPESSMFRTATTDMLVTAASGDDVARYGYARPVLGPSPRPAGRRHVVIDVPGTTGTALADLARRQVARRRPIETLVTVAPYGAAELSSSGVEPAATITVLRDPVERVAAWWTGVATDPAEPLHDEVVGRGSTLVDLVGRGDALELDNLQVRLLSGVGDDVGFGELGEEHLQLAELHVLDPGTFAGVAEEIDATLVALHQWYDWRRLGAVPPRLAPATHLLTTDELAVIEATNRLDRRLHDTALRVFHERWRREATPMTKVRRRTLRVERRLIAALDGLRSRRRRAA